jgi:YfiH family protein
MNVITPDWSAPDAVMACVTTRESGLSQAPYEYFNVGLHVGDDPRAVSLNRQLLAGHFGLDHIGWLEQVHSTRVLQLLPETADACPTADASWTEHPGLACAVMTADCLPVLFAAGDGRCVGAAHAGWRGLCEGILENTLAAMPVDPAHCRVWLGPAIGPDVFEVGPEVRAAFCDHNPAAEAAFRPSPAGRWLADIYALARQRLQAQGVRHIYGEGFCTFTDTTRFYSYRRARRTGRMVSLVWLRG